jgi:hypothetical protein
MCIYAYGYMYIHIYIYIYIHSFIVIIMIYVQPTSFLFIIINHPVILASLGRGLLHGDLETTGDKHLTIWKVKNIDFIALQGV